tara:strand:- start:622 stop:2097 length:1476 start_codon:yes stop_codon:yes gene_type:complete
MQLEVYPNFTKVSGDYDPQTVDEATRFKKAGYHHSNAFKSHAWDGYTRLFMAGKKMFPTGLLSRVLRQYRKSFPKVHIEIDDRRSFTSNYIPASEIELDGITLYTHQVAAADAMLAKKFGVLWAATNSGKTECAIAVIKSLGQPAVFLTKGKDLQVQTYDRFCSRLGSEDIGFISSSKWDVRKFTVASADTLGRRLTPSRNKKTGEYPQGWEEKKQQVVDFLSSVNVMFIDECHQAAAKGLWNVGRVCNASYRFGLSGTPFKRGDKQDLKLIALTGEVVHKISNKEMIEEGVSVPVDINMIDCDEPDLPHRLDYDQVYSSGVVENDFRNRIICNLANKHYADKKQILILVKRISHGHTLDNMLNTFSSTAFVPHKFIWGDQEVEERTSAIQEFKDGLCRILISSVILDVGIDIPNIDVMILAGGGKSYIKALQRIGRGLRLGLDKDKLVVYDFVDLTHKYLADHAIGRLSAYAKEDCFNIANLSGSALSDL